MDDSNEFNVLIVTYNSAAEIIDLLKDIEKCDKQILKRTILIDNASSDKTVQVIKVHYPQIRLIENNNNLGYSKAVNQGFEMTSSQFVFLINPDIRLTQKNFFTKLLEVAKKSTKVAAVGPLQFVITNQEKRLNFTWSYYSINGLKIYLYYLFNYKTSVSRKPFPTMFLNCGCLLINKIAYYKVGRLNEKYFMYGEEPDLFFKFKKHKYLAYLHPGVSVIHFRERSVKSLPGLKQIKLKIIAFNNVADAVFRGIIGLLQNKL